MNEVEQGFSRRPKKNTLDDVTVRASSGARRLPPRDPAKPLSEVVEKVLVDLAQRMPPPESPEVATVRSHLEREWAELVGPRFAELLRPGPTAVRPPATLIVWAKHSVALFEAQRQLRDLVRRIRQRCPAAPWTSVQFRLEPTDLVEPEMPSD